MFSATVNLLARFQFVLYPLLVHVGVVLGHAHWGTLLLPLFFAVNARPWQATGRERTTGLLGLLGLLLLAAWSLSAGAHHALFLPPVLIIAAIMYPFVLSLRPGRTPLITRFHQLAPSNGPGCRRGEAEITVYTRRLTWWWALLLGGLLLDAVLLAWLAPLEVWSLFTNVINYLLLLALLVGEWIYRMFWFRSWISPLQLARVLLTVDHRELLR